MRTRKGLFGVAVVATVEGVLLTTLAGCGKGPTQPSQIDGQVQAQQQTTLPSQSTLLSIDIRGNARLQNPGDTTQLTAIARYADDTTRDVTTEANWGTGTRIFTVRHGLVTAIAYGTATVVVSLPSGGGIEAKATIRVQPEGTFFLKGRVTEQGGFVVVDASVRVTFGSQTFAAATGLSGDYLLPAAGDVTMTVEKDAYATQTKRFTVQGDKVVDVELQRGDRGAFAGIYTLTITASPSCATLPPEVMRRRYTARINERSDGTLTVDLSGALFWDWLSDNGYAGFIGRRDGDHVRFDIADSYPSDYVVIEQIADGTILSYKGTADGTTGGTSLVATFDGTFIVTTVQERTAQVIASCKASDHRLEFVRSGM